MTTTPPKINLSPKERFLQSSDQTNKHRDLVDSETFQRGCDFAMLEMTRLLSDQVNNANESIPAALMLRGAHEFLKVFRNLSEKPMDLPQVAKNRGLDYKA